MSNENKPDFSENQSSHPENPAGHPNHPGHPGHLDDPRLTACALGEMDMDERAAFEAEIRDDAAAQAALAGIRALAGDLRAALAAEPVNAGAGGPPANAEAASSRPPPPPVSPTPEAGGRLRVLDGGAADVDEVARERERRREEQRGREDDPYRRSRRRFPYFLVSGLAAACFAVFFFAHVLPRQHAFELARKEQMERDMAERRRMENEKRASAYQEPAMASETRKQVREARISNEGWGAPASDSYVVAGEATNGAKQFAAPRSEVARRRSEREAQAGFAAPAVSLDSLDSKYRGFSTDNLTLAAGTAAPAQPFNTEYQPPPAPAPAPRPAPMPSLALSAVPEKSEIVSMDSFTVTAPREGMAKSTAASTVPAQPFNTESYAHQPDSRFSRVADAPVSTFAADVDTASYTNVRRFIDGGRLPPPDAVHIEELVNYFPYDYAPPPRDGGAPFAASLEVAAAPWNPAHRLVRIGIKGREFDAAARPPVSLVFLLDVSGSMDNPAKLPLVKDALRMLLDTLRPDDRVAIVTYAGSSGLALPSTPASKKRDILAALDALRAQGSTNGAMGIQLAYDVAKANFIEGGANRVILCTDGDFNVGVTSDGELTRLIEEKARSGVFLTVLGFGMGNYKNAKLELLANKGNGQHAYIDSRTEARRMLAGQAGATLVTIAKDVKLQVEFNPAAARAYRLIGYENRRLAREDFNNDKVDAGEIGAGHTVTALYEVVPAGAPASADGPAAADDDDAPPPVDPLKYQPSAPRPVNPGLASAPAPVKPELAGELLTLKIRFKPPTADKSELLEFTLEDSARAFAGADGDFKFAAAVAAFGMVLRDSPGKAGADYDRVLDWAESGLGPDADGRRREFLGLVRRAKEIAMN
ncbi:MAG: VWA domain-containing protein [Opitutaceae bacterium]|jgi:Ca-activated chloride channel family protein|nr:VWA domain-containing protein [Opitutaceae bacterium]